MNDFDTFFIESHRESVKETGNETFTIGAGDPIECVFSEITQERTPDIAGFNESAEATATVETSLLPDGDLQGRKLTRTKDSRTYRIATVVDNGGGLTDLILQAEAEASS